MRSIDVTSSLSAQELQRAYISAFLGFVSNALAAFIFVIFVQKWSLLDLYRVGIRRLWFGWTLDASTYVNGIAAAIGILLLHVALVFFIRHRKHASTAEALKNSVGLFAPVRVYFALLLSLSDLIAFEPILLVCNVIAIGMVLQRFGRLVRGSCSNLTASHRFSFASSMIVLMIPFMLVALQKRDSTYSWLLTGDSPSYLLITESICRDFDLDLSNNSIPADVMKSASVDTPDFRRHNPDVAEGTEEYSRIQQRFNGQVWSTHRCGTSLVIAPAYALGSLFGGLQRPFIALWLSILLAIGINEIRRACVLLTNDHILSAWVSFGTVVSIPVSTISTSIYPEIVMFTLMSRAINLCLNRATWRRAIEMGVLMGFAPWLQDKYAAWMLPLLLVYWLRNRQQMPRLIASCFAGICFLIPMIWRNLFLYGQVIPKNSLGHFVSLTEMLKGPLFGVWFDWGYGLLALYPLLVVAPVGFVLGLRDRANRSIWLAWSASVICSITLIACWYCWHGGFAPPNRFTMTIIPLLMPAVAMAVSRLNSSARIMVYGLWGIGVSLGLTSLFHPQAWYSRKLLSFSGASILGWDSLLYRFSYFTQRPHSWVYGVGLALLWGLLLILLFHGLVCKERRNKLIHAILLVLVASCFFVCAYTNPYTDFMNSARPPLDKPLLISEPMALQNVGLAYRDDATHFVATAILRRSTSYQKYAIYLHGYDAHGNMMGTWDFALSQIVRNSPNSISSSPEGFSEIFIDKKLLFGNVSPARIEFGIYRPYPSGRSERIATFGQAPCLFVTQHGL